MFKKGEIVLTRGINDRVCEDAKFSKAVIGALLRYSKKDWGELCEEDKLLNDMAVENGEDRIVAKYLIEDSEAIYIITEADRSCTTILFTSKY